MLVNYRLEDQVIPLVYGNPAILQNVRSGGDFYRAAVAQDRNAADREPELYFGHPGAAQINGLQMAANGAASVALFATWTALKKLNRQTAAAFDERIALLRAK